MQQLVWIYNEYFHDPDVDFETKPPKPFPRTHINQRGEIIYRGVRLNPNNCIWGDPQVPEGSTVTVEQLRSWGLRGAYQYQEVKE